MTILKVQTDKPLNYIKWEDLKEYLGDGYVYFSDFIIGQTTFVDGPYLHDVDRYLRDYGKDFPKNRYWHTMLGEKIELSNLTDDHIRNILRDVKNINSIYRIYFNNRTIGVKQEETIEDAGEKSGKYTQEPLSQD